MKLKINVISHIKEGAEKWVDLPAVTRVLERYANKVRNGAIKNIRGHDLIDTGNMINSIQIDRPTPWSREVGNTPAGYYAIFHEMGTKYLPALPFLGPAADVIKQDFYKEISKVI